MELSHRSGNATIFSEWEWTEAFWKYSVPGKDPLVLLARTSTGRLVGVMPLARTRHFGVLHKMEVLGCNPVGYPIADYSALLVERDYEGPVWLAVLQHLKNSSWSMIDLRNCMTPTPGHEAHVASFYSQAASHMGWGVRVQAADICRTISLPTSFDAYLSQLSANSRQNIRRKLRKLADAGFTMEQVDTGNEADFNEAFEALVEFHQERWSEHPSGGGFSNQRAIGLQRYLATSLDKTGHLDLRAVRDPEGKVVGVMYNLRGNKVAYFYGLGVSQDDKYSSLSLGTCLLASSIDAAIAAGCHTFDLMRGDHDYKRHFGGYTTSNMRVTIYRSAWLPRVETAAREFRSRLPKPAALRLSSATE